MFGHMSYFTSHKNRRSERSRPKRDGVLKFKPTGEPPRWPTRPGG